MNVLKKYRWPILAVATLAITSVFFFGFKQAQLAKDGLESFTGEERRAAQQALDQINDSMSHGIEAIGNLGVFNRQVTRVEQEEKPMEGVYSSCTAFYKVYVADISFFGWHINGGDFRYVCIK